MTPIAIDSHYEELLFSIPLFRDLRQEIKQTLLERLNYRLYSASRGEVVIRQGDKCAHLCVILTGRLEVNIIDYYGNEVLVEHLQAPRVFATPHLFGDDTRFPATFRAIEPTTLMLATKESTFKLISEFPDLLRNFLCITGRCNACTTVRLDILSMKTIRERVAVYLLKHLVKGSSTSRMEHSVAQLAEYLNVSRPALSTELGKMEREGIIRRVDKSSYEINLSALRATI